MDLKFPHHENEIAQSEGATGEVFANLWMHNGFVQINDEKMSKSLGNFFTIRDVLSEHRSEVVRFFILNSHYRSPLAYSNEQMGHAAAGLERLYTALRGIEVADEAPDSDYSKRFHAAMQDDFNTAESIAVLFELAREINRQRKDGSMSVAELAAELRQLGGELGLLQEDPEAYFQLDVADGPSADEIEALIAARLAAKASKDFAEADRIRDELIARGIRLEDGAGGTTWSRS